MCGVGFSGKSTLAKEIANHTGAVLVSQDGMYFEKKEELSIDEDNDDQWRMLLELCKKRILENLKKGNSVVFDNVNTRFEHREELKQLAKEVGAETKVIFLDTPIEIQRERQMRNKETGERHDVKQEYLDQAIKELEVPTEAENIVVFRPDTDLVNFLARLQG